MECPQKDLFHNVVIIILTSRMAVSEVVVNVGNFFIIFFIHLGYSFNFTVVSLPIMRGIPPPSGGIVGKNRSIRIKILTSVNSR